MHLLSMAIELLFPSVAIILLTKPTQPQQPK